MTSKIIHFDTINGEDQLDESYSQKIGTNNLSHNYFTRIPLVNPLYLVSNIELSSIEFSNTTYNIRADNGSNIFSLAFIYQGGQYGITVTLPSKNYTAIADLLTDLNSYILTDISVPILAGFSIILSVNPKDNGKIILKSNCDTSQGTVLLGSISVVESIMTKYILGFTFNKTTSLSDFALGNATTGFSTLSASNNYNLQADNYFNINFSNINHSGSANADAKVVTFKLPLSSPYNEVIYYTSGNNFPQCLMLESNKTVTHLMLKVTDRWGFPVYGKTGFSFSLTFYF